MVTISFPRLRILNDEQVCSIHLAGLDILERTGVKVMSEDALKTFDEAGANIDYRMQKARIPRHLVKEALKKAPESFKVYARNPKNTLSFREGEVYFGPSSTIPYILDPETSERRKATLKDNIQLMRLLDYLENIHSTFGVLVSSDIPSMNLRCVCDLLIQYKYTTKVAGGFMRGRQIARDSIRMASVVAGGEEELRNKPVLVGGFNTVSPLQLSKDLVQGLMEYASMRVPVIISPEILAGGTGPVSLAGLLAQKHAEALSAITLAQMVGPGTPVIYGTVSTIMDARTGGIATGAIELPLLTAATAQIGRYCGLPTRGIGMSTDSKIEDIQAGYESALTALMAALAGVNFITYAGSLESTLTVSFEKYVIDNEVLGMVIRALRGIDVNEETLALDVIHKVGPGGHFLGEKHTRRLLRVEHFIPKLSDRDRREIWERRKDKDVRERARKKFMQILKGHEPEPLDKNVQRELQKIVEEVRRREAN